MAKQRKTIGTGITAREVVTYDGVDMIPGWLELDLQWEAKRQKGGGNYGAVSLHIIEWCRQIIADSGTGLREIDTPADFAERIIQKHTIAEAAIKRGHADWAAKFAYEVGVLAAQAKMKLDWEKHALRGKKNLDAIQYGSWTSNQQRYQDREKEHQRWNVEAARIWKRSPNLSKRGVADMVRHRLGLTEKIGTIADKLKKPPTAR
jgi:hypothetical protein